MFTEEDIQTYYKVTAKPRRRKLKLYAQNVHILKKNNLCSLILKKVLK